MTKLMRIVAIASQRDKARQVLISSLDCQISEIRDYIAIEIAKISLGGLYQMSIARASELLLSLKDDALTRSQARDYDYGAPTLPIAPLHSLAQKVKTSCFGICLICLREGKAKPEICTKHEV